MKQHINSVDGIESNPQLTQKEDVIGPELQKLLEALGPITIRKTLLVVLGVICALAVVWFLAAYGLSM